MTKKVKELNGEIVGNAAKVQTALRLSEEDQTTIVTLKKEVEKAWKLVDASHEKVPANMPLSSHEKLVVPIMHSSDGAVNASILIAHTMAMCALSTLVGFSPNQCAVIHVSEQPS